MTNQPLVDRRFVHNYNLKNAIEDYCHQQELIAASCQFLTFNVRFGRPPIEWIDKPTLKLRISLLGGSNVGKTTLAHYLQHGTQSNVVYLKSAATVGPDLFFFYLDQLYENRYVVIIQVTDIPGMERYESCCDSHFRSCHGAFLLTDATDIDTLEHVELYWYKQLKLKGKEYVESTLICNKIDLLEDKCDDDYRKIFFRRAEEFASSNNMPIYHISAIRGDNIQVMFKELILSILQNQLLVRQIKGNDDIDDKLSNDKQERRQTSIIQLFSRTPSDRNNSDRSSTVNCCKLA
jgi:GTPase SAR1 family protein